MSAQSISGKQITKETSFDIKNIVRVGFELSLFKFEFNLNELEMSQFYASSNELELELLIKFTN